MPGIRARINPIVPRNQPYHAGAGEAARAIRALRIPGGESIARGFETLTDGLNQVNRAMRQNAPQVEEFLVTDSSGRVLAALGEYEVDGIVYSGGYFTELRAGDPYGESNPANSILTVTPDGRVCVGENGWVDVLDPFGESAAWLGTQADTLPVTGAADNGSGLIRLTVVGHTLQTGDTTPVLNVGGVPDSTGVFSVTKVDADHIDLQNSTFVGSYTSGGTINRVLHISGVTNAAGLIRIQTAVPHGYETGDTANVQNVGGVTAANGQWIVDVIDATHFDLVGSTFSGAYTTGGVCLRYFAGMLAQTFAIGNSFADYKLRAFRNGALRLRDAEVQLNGTNATIELDPTAGTISVTRTGGGNRTRIQDGIIFLDDTTGAEDLSYLYPGYLQLIKTDIHTGAGSAVVELRGYSTLSPYGPRLDFRHYEGRPSAATATQAGDSMGGFVAWGYDGIGESQYAAGVRAVATENHDPTAHGSQLVFEVTPNGSTTASNAMTLDQDGKLNVPAAYKVNGNQVISARKSKPTQTTRAAGPAYTANEQAMLNELKTWQDGVNTALSALAGGHGLWT